MAASVADEAIDPEVVRLVERAQGGDAQAFAVLYDRYVDQIYRYVRRRVGTREIAEDLTGDVFLRAWRRFDQFTWQGVDIAAWLTTIARNRVADHFKSARVRLERSTDDGFERDGSGIDAPDRVAEARDLTRALAEALEELSEDHREVIELRFVHDLSVTETAAVLDRSVGATKALQYRALKALAAVIRDRPGFEHLLTAGLGGLIAVLGVLG